MSNLSDFMGKSMEKIREMVDVNTIIGNPITTPDGTTLIPVSKVSFGFASGGSECRIERAPNLRLLLSQAPSTSSVRRAHGSSPPRLASHE